MASRVSNRPPIRSATMGPFTGTYKLTGIVIKADPRGSYKPSHVINLLVDGESRTAFFQQRQTQSTLTWEVKPAVTITSKSIISIQPREARTLIRRKKVETVTIQGDAVFRFCSSRPGDKHDFERACTGFDVLLSVVIQKDIKLRDDLSGGSGREVGVAALFGENGREVFFGPPTAPNPFKGALDSLHDFIELPVIPPSLYEITKETSDALKIACNSMPTRDAEADIQKLGEQIQDLLVTIQLPKFSERLASQTQTVTDILKLVENAALFAEDCSKLDFKELGTTDNGRSILEEFERQIWVLKRNFSFGKETYGLSPPYHRPEVPTVAPPVPLLSQSVEETGSEVSVVEPEPDSVTVAVDEDQKLLDLLDPDFTPTEQINLGCLNRTREELLSTITAWLDDASDSNVLWLSGAPGTGKTAIAWSLVSELEKQQRSAGEFFVRQHEHSPRQLWLTLAYKMAKFHPAIKGEVYKALTQDESVDLNDINIAFDKLVAGPLNALDARLRSCRLVFLIDGLEQCGQGYSTWQTLLDTLPQWLSLPRHCKLVITSRHQNDIAKVFEDRAIKRIELLTGDDVDTNTQYDVRTYLDHRFAEMRQDKSISENWPDGEATSKLADHTKGFFTWAAVALRSIQDTAGDRDKLLTTIIEGGTTIKFDKFDQYLEEVFRMAFPSDPPEAFRAIVGIVALSKHPLTMADLGQFLRQRFPSSSEASLEETCYELLPIISIDKESGTVKIRHKAYGDYLIDHKRCTLSEGAFLIDRSKTHRKMTISSLKIMQQGLKFNICGLKSSYLMNDQIEDKDNLIKQCIPSHLAYACQHWADHLRGIVATEKRDTTVVNLLRNFLKFHLLYWLETLSLLEKSHTASKSLLVAAEWLEPTDKDLSLLAADASRFSLTFAEVIAASAPHVYLSALPFAPASSLISKWYRDQFPRTIKVLQEEGTKWPPMRLSISTDSYVNSVSVHPDGKRVAVAMDSGVAMVVSITMGESQFYLSGHGGYTVRTIAYSPSGKRIATGCDDKRLRVYEAENGSLLFRPFEVHADWIRSIAWSPDGQRIVTGSDDRKVKVVVIETGQVLYDTAFHDDWVRTVLCTTEFFISGSDDRTVRIYDVSTGTQSGEAWTTGQTGYIMAIALTLDNKILAAGSEDCTIVLYDMDTRTTINKPIRGHSGPIRSLAFSKDGKLLASGSEDHTVRLWHVPTGQRLCDPLYGHTSYVSSVRFSPDTKQLITGGEDCTVRFFDMDALPIRRNFPGGSGIFRAAIALDDDKTVVASDGSIVSRWNVSEGDVENIPLEGNPEHLVNVQSVSISPDGRLVATAANRAVIIWKADDGSIMWGPLEGHDDTIYALNFSADSKMIVSGGEDQKVWVWSTETGQSVCGPMEGHTAGVRGVCFSPDGKQVATGSYDTTAIMWSVDSGERIHEPLSYHRDWVCGVAYSPNGLYLATASDDLSVAIWDVVTGERVLHTLTHGEYTRVVNWSPDSKKIVTGARDDTIRVFDVETGTLLCEPLTGHKDAPTAVSFRSPLHGNELEVVSSSLDGTVRVWGLRTSFVKTQTFSNKHRDWIHAISFSPVDNSITSGGDDGRLIGMDVVTGSLKFNISAHKDWIRCVTYSPDGMKIATCSDDRTISIWDAENGERLMEPLEGHTGAVLSIEFSPGGNLLISGSEDKTVRTWDTHSLSNNSLRTYRGHNGAVNAVAYAHQGELIVSGSAAGEIAVWEGRAGDECILQFIAHSGPVLSICVHGEKVFSSSEDGSIRVWELSTGKLEALFSIPVQGQVGPINAIALSPDGRRIVSAAASSSSSPSDDSDASLRMFDARTGEACTLPLRFSSRIFAVTVSRDGALVACGGEDRSVHVWRANVTRRVVWPDNFIRRARGLEFCLVDEQGVLADFSLRSDGWLMGRTNKPICWIPSSYRAGLWTPRTVGILGALETILDLRKLVHGTEWERCKAYVFSDKT